MIGAATAGLPAPRHGVTNLLSNTIRAPADTLELGAEDGETC